MNEVKTNILKDKNRLVKKRVENRNKISCQYFCRC